MELGFKFLTHVFGVGFLGMEPEIKEFQVLLKTKEPEPSHL